MKEIIICDSYFSRGNHFRREFTNLGEVRNLIPNHVHVMALTASATERTIARVSAILGLVAPKIITVSSHSHLQAGSMTTQLSRAHQHG